MKRPIAPCKDCEFKTEGCHSTCEIYQTFRKDLDEYKELIRGEKVRNNEQNAIEVRRIRIAKKGVRRKK